MVTELAANGDRAVALVGANDGRLWLLVGIDVGNTFGRELWKQLRREPAPPNGALYGVMGNTVVLREPLAALRLDDGSHDEEVYRRVRHLEYHGELGSRWARFETMCDGWELGVARDHRTTATAYDPSALSVTSPAAGMKRVELPPLLAPSNQSIRLMRAHWSVSVAESLGYAVSSPFLRGEPRTAEPQHDDWNFVNVQAVDLATTRISLDVGAPVDLHGEFHMIEGIALDRAFLVVVTTPATCTLMRFERAPSSNEGRNA